MYGYVVMNKPELKIREYEEYRAYYCGLCKALKRQAGMRGQLALSYDMTFLALLLTALYEPETKKYKEHCIVHPIGSQSIRENSCIEYAADMSLMLTWYKCRDDYADDRNMLKAAYGSVLAKKVRRIENQYPRQAKSVSLNLGKLVQLEKEQITDIDKLSACFGNLLADIFVMKEDEWQTYLSNFGFYLGKFVYIMDAYDDVEKDRKKGSFNPFLEREKQDGLDDWVKQLLIMCATEFAKSFEKMPIIQDAGILRNIIYSGVFCRYANIRKQRAENMEEQHEKSI